MKEFHSERYEQKPGREGLGHFDATWLTSEDFIRGTEGSSNPEMAGDEAITLLKANFDYIRDIMNDEIAPGVRRMVERFLKKV